MKIENKIDNIGDSNTEKREKFSLDDMSSFFSEIGSRFRKKAGLPQAPEQKISVIDNVLVDSDFNKDIDLELVEEGKKSVNGTEEKLEDLKPIQDSENIKKVKEYTQENTLAKKHENIEREMEESLKKFTDGLSAESFEDINKLKSFFKDSFNDEISQLSVDVVGSDGNTVNNFEQVFERLFGMFLGKAEQYIKKFQIRKEDSYKKKEAKKAGKAIWGGAVFTAVGTGVDFVAGPVGAAANIGLRSITGGAVSAFNFGLGKSYDFVAESNSLKKLAKNVDEEKWGCEFDELKKKEEKAGIKNFLNADLGVMFASELNKKEELNDFKDIVKTMNDEEIRLINEEKISDNEKNKKTEEANRKNKNITDLIKITEEIDQSQKENDKNEKIKERQELIKISLEDGSIQQFANELARAKIDQAGIKKQFGEELNEAVIAEIIPIINLDIEREISILIGDSVAQEKFGDIKDSSFFKKLYNSKLAEKKVPETFIEAIVKGLVSGAVAGAATSASFGSVYMAMQRLRGAFREQMMKKMQKDGKIIKTADEIIAELKDIMNNQNSTIEEINDKIIDARARIKLPDIQEIDRQKIELEIDRMKSGMIMSANLADVKKEEDSVIKNLIEHRNKEHERAKELNKEAKSQKSIFTQGKAWVFNLNKTEKMKVLASTVFEGVKGGFFGAIGAGAVDDVSDLEGSGDFDSKSDSVAVVNSSADESLVDKNFWAKAKDEGKILVEDLKESAYAIGNTIRSAGNSATFGGSEYIAGVASGLATDYFGTEEEKTEREEFEKKQEVLRGVQEELNERGDWIDPEGTDDQELLVKFSDYLRSQNILGVANIINSIDTHSDSFEQDLKDKNLLDNDGNLDVEKLDQFIEEAQKVEKTDIKNKLEILEGVVKTVNKLADLTNKGVVLNSEVINSQNEKIKNIKLLINGEETKLEKIGIAHGNDFSDMKSNLDKIHGDLEKLVTEQKLITQLNTAFEKLPENERKIFKKHMADDINLGNIRDYLGKAIDGDDKKIEEDDLHVGVQPYLDKQKKLSENNNQLVEKNTELIENEKDQKEKVVVSDAENTTNKEDSAISEIRDLVDKTPIHDDVKDAILNKNADNTISQQEIEKALEDQNKIKLLQNPKLSIGHIEEIIDGKKAVIVQKGQGISQALDKAMANDAKVTVVNPDGAIIPEFDANLVHTGDIVVLKDDGTVIVFKPEVTVDKDDSLQGRYDDIKEATDKKLENLGLKPDEIKAVEESEIFNQGDNFWTKQIDSGEAKSIVDFINYHSSAIQKLDIVDRKEFFDFMKAGDVKGTHSVLYGQSEESMPELTKSNDESNDSIILNNESIKELEQKDNDKINDKIIEEHLEKEKIEETALGLSYLRSGGYISEDQFKIMTKDLGSYIDTDLQQVKQTADKEIEKILNKIFDPSKNKSGFLQSFAGTVENERENIIGRLAKPIVDLNTLNYSNEDVFGHSSAILGNGELERRSEIKTILDEIKLKTELSPSAEETVNSFFRRGFMYAKLNNIEIIKHEESISDDTEYDDEKLETKSKKLDDIKVDSELNSMEEDVINKFNSIFDTQSDVAINIPSNPDEIKIEQLDEFFKNLKQDQIDGFIKGVASKVDEIKELINSPKPPATTSAQSILQEHQMRSYQESLGKWEKIFDAVEKINSE